MKKLMHVLKSIHFQVLMLIILTLVPALGLLHIANLEERHREIDHLKKGLMKMALVIADQEEHLIDGTRQLLLSLCVLREQFPFSFKLNSGFLYAVLSRFHRYLNIAVADVDGNIVSSAVPLKSPVNIAKNHFFRQSVERKTFVVGPYESNPVVDGESIVCAQPLISAKGNVLSVIFATMNLSRLMDFEKDIISQVSEYAVLTKIDDKGTILLQTKGNPEDVIGQKFIKKTILDAVLHTQNGIVDEIGTEGKPHLYAFSRVDSPIYVTNIYLILDIPASAVFKDVDCIYNRIFWGMIFSGTFLILFGWTIAELTFSGQVKKLVGTACEIGKGNLDARFISSFVGTSELNTIGDALNHMASALKERDIRLRQQQRLEALGTFASGIAHEINSPLMGIMGYAELIKSSEGVTQEISECTEEIIMQNKRIETLVKNLLSFAKRDDQPRSISSVSNIVSAVLSLANSIMRRDRIQIKVDVPQNLPEVYCSPQQIQQILINLLTNARDALNEKYPSANENKLIRITATTLESATDKLIRITVEDRGAGIADRLRDRIFEPFYTTKHEGKGTGLGLSISYDIAKAHNGKLYVESAVGQWTKFHLEIPVVSNK